MKFGASYGTSQKGLVQQGSSGKPNRESPVITQRALSTPHMALYLPLGEEDETLNRSRIHSTLGWVRPTWRGFGPNESTTLAPTPWWARAPSAPGILDQESSTNLPICIHHGFFTSNRNVLALADH